MVLLSLDHFSSSSLVGFAAVKRVLGISKSLSGPSFKPTVSWKSGCQSACLVAEHRRPQVTKTTPGQVADGSKSFDFKATRSVTFSCRLELCLGERGSSDGLGRAFNDEFSSFRAWLLNFRTLLYQLSFVRKFLHAIMSGRTLTNLRQLLRANVNLEH